jgi:predicted O-methyltransferase YrrM
MKAAARYTLEDSKVKSLLEHLFEESCRQEEAGFEPPDGISALAGSAQARADAYASEYIPISPEGGQLLYALTRAIRPDTVVEFGTSFGISTLYLAAALADNAKGRVFTTELSQAKVNAARANLVKAGLEAWVTILPGDALETLRAIEGPIGLAHLDGWKDMCLPILKLIEPKLAPGAIVIGDDIDQSAMQDYLDYVRGAENGYVSVAFPVGDGMEVSCRAALAAASFCSGGEHGALNR